VTETDFPGAAAVRVFDGLDLGWIFTSNEHIKAKHDLSVVSDTSGRIKKESSATELPAMSVGEIKLGLAPNSATAQTYYAMSAEPDESGRAALALAAGTSFDVGSCQPVGAGVETRQFKQDGSDVGGAAAADDIWGYNDNVSSRVSQPEECFRLTVDEGLARNYLDPYEVTLTLNSADLSWGPIAWEAFEDISCDGKMFTPDVDVCELLAEEVDLLPTPDAVPVVQLQAVAGTNTSNATANVTNPTLAGFNLEYENAADDRHRFTAMWYLNDRTPRPDDDDRNLYPTVDLADAVGPTGSAFGAEAQQNLVYGVETDISYAAADGNATVTADSRRTVWVPTLDKDYDPMYGDLGKVTIDGENTADNFAMTDDSSKCSADDGGTAATGTAADPDADANSTLCNADGVEIETSVSFVDGLGYGCDPVKVEYTITCDWNASGNAAGTVTFDARHIGVADPDDSEDIREIDDFLDCEVE